MKRTLILPVYATLLCLGAAGRAQESQPPAEQPQPPIRVRISQGVSQVLIIKKVQPEYPKKARKKHVESSVLMQAVISKTGDITDLQLISGDEVPAPLALNAVKQWKYQPYLLEGKPVEVETKITVNYELSK
jgi:protein TonB